jgi:nitrate reductase alpha subunit
MVRKDYFTHNIGKGFLVDVCTVTGAPKESMVKVALAERGGLDGKGDWDPIKSGYTPGNESEEMKKYLKGEFIVD